MKQVYTAILARLKDQVPALKWIDLDDGTLDHQTERPGVAFPCAIISISLPSCNDICAGVQSCRAKITVRVAQNIAVNRTGSAVTEPVRESALERYRLVDQVYAALQGFETDEFCSMSCTGMGMERRSDGLFVYGINFFTEFEYLTTEE